MDTQQQEADEEAQRLQEHLTEADREGRQLEEGYQVWASLEVTCTESELMCYQAVNEEHTNGEEREARLVEQLKELRERCAFPEQTHAILVALFTTRPLGEGRVTVFLRGDCRVRC